MSEELTQLTALELRGLLDRGEVSSREITEQVLGRLDRLNPLLSAFITPVPEIALSEADEADRRLARGERLSAIDGIPYSLKDLDHTTGIRTTLGSKFFEDQVPDFNSAVADALRSSGGVLLGKTNTPHMGYKDMCDNYVSPTCVNPWDTSRTPGGSSGGAASAVAAGLGPLAQGGDGAGSVRIPASLTGTVGFKPTFGRVPTFPARTAWTHRVHNGPIARTVGDAALMLSVMARFDMRDPQSVRESLPEYTAPEEARPLKGRKALFSVDYGYGLVSAKVTETARSAINTLRALGCEVVEVDEAPWPDPSGFHSVLYGAGGFPDAFRPHPEWVEPDFTRLLERGSGRSGREMMEAEAARSEFYQGMLGVMDEYDFIISPTMPLVAWSAIPGPGQRDIDTVPLPDLLSRAFLVYPFNLSGQPAITVPCGLADGLPVGLQLAGRRYADLDVLRAGAAVEAELALGISWPEPTTRPTNLDDHLAALEPEAADLPVSG